MADVPQDLFSLLRSDIRDLRDDFNARLDRLVSQEAFSAEQKRRDELHAALGQDLVDERIAREKAIAVERDARKTALAETDQRSRRAWSSVRWTVGTLIALATMGVSAWAYLIR